MNKKTIIILIAGLIVLGLVGFITLSETLFAPKKEIKFRITWEQHSSRGVAIDKIIQRYNESQKKVHVTLVGGNENVEDYKSLLTEDEIDVYMVPYRYVRDPRISKELLEITELYMEHEGQYYDTIKDLSKSEDGIVSVPWIGHSMALIYNKDIMAQAGINPEDFTSLNDLADACKIIYDKTGKKGLGLIGAESHDLTWMISQFIYTYGGCLVNCDIRGDQTEVTINSKQAEQAIDFYINTLGEYAQEDWQEHAGSEVVEAFRNEEIAFEIQGPWGITDIWKNRSGFDVGAISLSQFEMYSEVGPLMLSISKDSQNIESSKDFIKYLMEKSTLEAVMEGEYDEKYEAYYPYRVPLRKDMEDSDFFERYPDFLVFIEGYKMPSINTPTSTWAAEYKHLYAYYIHKAITGEMSIKKALESIANKIEID